MRSLRERHLFLDSLEFVRNSMKVVFAVVLLLVAAFCVFGFFAAGEPGAANHYYRVGYPIAGLGALATAIGLLVTSRRGL